MSNDTKEPSIVYLFFQALSLLDFFLIIIFFLLLWWVKKIYNEDSNKDKKIKLKLASFLTVIVLLINVANLYPIFKNLPTASGENHNSFRDM
jgi:flagellar biogenesis protein FliO